MTQTGHPLLGGCPALVLDAASPRIFVGVLSSNQDGWAWQKSVTTEAGTIEQCFPAIQNVLDESGLALSEIRNWLVCEGPGNLLGLRTTVLAVETWRASGVAAEGRIWTYSSLELMQHLVDLDTAGDEDLDIWMDWRRGHWFRCRRRGGNWLPADTVALDQLESAVPAVRVYHIRGRGNWPGPPLTAETLEYQPQRLTTWLEQGGAGVQPSDHCQVRGEPVKTYVRWSGNRHGG